MKSVVVGVGQGNREPTIIFHIPSQCVARLIEEEGGLESDSIRVLFFSSRVLDQPPKNVVTERKFIIGLFIGFFFFVVVVCYTDCHTIAVSESNHVIIVFIIVLHCRGCEAGTGL